MVNKREDKKKIRKRKGDKNEPSDNRIPPTGAGSKVRAAIEAARTGKADENAGPSADTAGTAGTAGADIPTRDVLYFRAGLSWYGFETREVPEVLQRTTVSPMPLTPGYLAGVVPYRGDVIAVINLPAFLGHHADSGPADGKRDPAAARRLVVVRGEGMTVAIATDAIGGVVPVAGEAIAELGENADRHIAEFAAGSLEIDGHLAILLTAGGLLKRAMLGGGKTRPGAAQKAT